MRRALIHSSRCLAALLAAGAIANAAAAPARADEVPHIKHFFIIVLENENAEVTFGMQKAPYLATTMREAGAYLPNYYGIGHNSLDNYIAMISGQPPNMSTQADCLTFSPFILTMTESDGVAVGQGCVYPSSVQTVANQLENSGHSWRGYMEDMASSTTGEATTCRHPTIGAPDETQTARPTDQYAARHDPFVYFEAIIDYATCQRNVVDLSHLSEDLASESTTPEYVFITPDLCADGHDATCAEVGAPAGFAGINKFLSEWVPKIEASPAYKDHGALLTTFDESASGAQSCCNEPTGPNTLSNGGAQPGGGGGLIGAVVDSPCVKPGTETQSSYNHFSMLRWVEDNFGLSHLADASGNLSPFGSDVFDNPSCEPPPPTPAATPGKLHLRAQPKKARAGRKTVFRFRVSGEPPTCVATATVKFAGHRAKANRHGRAHIKATLKGHGKRVAVASAPNCGKAKATVRVMSTRRRSS